MLCRCFAVVVSLFAAALPALAQGFGSDRPMAPAPAAPTPAPAPMTPPGALPSFPTGAAPSMPRAAAPVQLPPQEPQHEWAVHPSHGEWMVCVKSYTGLKAKQHAAELCDHIRRTHKAAAYLFDRNYEERRRDEQRKADIRAAREQELTPFLQVQAETKKKAEAEGREFIDAPVTIRMPTVRIEEQWAVLVGGFKDMDTAAAAIAQIRRWPAPTSEYLMDHMVMQKPDENGRPGTTEATYLNPFTNSMSVPNPSIKKVAGTTMPLDPALVRLNEDEPLSVLKNPKGWTLIVKDFSIPLSVQSKDQDGSIIGRVFGANNDPGSILEATAKQARELAKALRNPDMERAAAAAAKRTGLTPRPLESFVLHVRTGSRVTVGSFDSPEDPALAEMQRLLANMSFKVERPGEGGRKIVEEIRLFDGITPMPVPRAR